MAYTPNPTWKDHPDTSTLVTAAKLNHIEDGIVAAAETADSAVAGLSGKADSSHQHAAGDISSGTLDVARVPNLPASKITSGTIAPARLGSGTADNTRFLRGDGTWQVPPTGGGGVTDHGALTGLADDDHPQYHNDARGDARYYTKTQVDTALTGKADASRGLPSGGSTGQVLAKASGSNYDTEWVDPPDEGGTGDGGVPPIRTPAVGRWMTSPNFISTNFSTAGEVRNNGRMPLYVPEAMTIDQVAFSVGTAEEGVNWTVTLLDDAGVALSTLGTADLSTTGQKVITLAAPLALAPGWYFIEGSGHTWNVAKFCTARITGWGTSSNRLDPVFNSAPGWPLVDEFTTVSWQHNVVVFWVRRSA